MKTLLFIFVTTMFLPLSNAATSLQNNMQQVTVSEQADSSKEIIIEEAIIEDIIHTKKAPQKEKVQYKPTY
jgi:hypothetical protein